MKIWAFLAALLIGGAGSALGQTPTSFRNLTVTASVPTFTACTGFLYGNGASPATCSLGLNISSLVSQTNSVSWGTNQNIGGGAVWNAAPVRAGGQLTYSANEGNGSSDEFLVTYQTTTAATPAPSLNTNASTSTSSAVLNFASVPATVIPGMQAQDLTTPAAIPFALTVLSTTSTTVTLSGNVAATVGNGDNIIFALPNFKGPLYLATIQNDPSFLNSVRSGNGLTVYSEIGTGVTNAYVEGVVSVAQGNGTGTGVLIGGEFDISPGASDTANSTHCDVSGVSNCHTNIWMANFGSVAGSWMVDSAVGGQGWKNGISLRNIASTGVALVVPNSVPIVSMNGAGNAYVDLLFADNLNNVQVGYGAPTVTFATHIKSAIGALSAPTVSSCGTSPSLSSGATDTRGVITVGSGTVTQCTLTFNAAYSPAPACVITGTDKTNIPAFGAAGQPATTGFYFQTSASMAGQTVSYICIQ